MQFLSALTVVLYSVQFYSLNTIYIYISQTGFEDPNRTCTFIEPDLNGSKWSSEGCMLNKAESSEKNVTCDCDHNTAFAIMMDVSGVQVRWMNHFS